jgi:hypothetical protein
VSDWTALWYRTDTTASTSTQAAWSVTPAYNTTPTYYAVYNRTLTISYSGNGNSGWSTLDTTATQYYNSNWGVSTPSFTLATNGFTRTWYRFNKWDLWTAWSIYSSWAPGVTESTIKTANAQWTANTNTPYKVYHQKEKLDGTYETVETEHLSWTTDTKVTPSRKSYAWFTSPAGQEITIKW